MQRSVTWLTQLANAMQRSEEKTQVHQLHLVSEVSQAGWPLSPQDGGGHNWLAQDKCGYHDIHRSVEGVRSLSDVKLQ